MKNIAVLVPALCLVALSMSAKSAHANGLNLAPYVGDTVSMTVEPYASNENNGAFYVGLTQVKIAREGDSLGSIEAFCDDFNHEISLPDNYTATVQAVSGNKTMEQEAYYGMMFGSTPSGNSAMDSDIQELIWNFTAPRNKQFAMNTEMTVLQSEMMQNYQNVSYAGSFYLNAGDGGQSFMTTDPSPVPEPSTLASFGTGLFAIAAFGRRRFLRS